MSDEMVTIRKSLLLEAREMLKAYIAGAEDVTEEEGTEGRSLVAALYREMGEQPDHENWASAKIIHLRTAI